MFLWEGVYADVSAGALGVQRRASDPLGDGVTGVGELPDVGTGIRT